jgi:hypothetical protein
MRPPPRLHPAEPASHQREQVIKPGNPRHEVIIGQHEPDNTGSQITKCCCRNSEAPPLTAEITGSAGASVQVSASSQLTAVAVGGHRGAGHNGE